MATDKSGNPHPFDVKTVEHLIILMAEHDLTEIALQEGAQRIRLRKGSLHSHATSPAPISAVPAPLPASVSTGTSAVVPSQPASKLLEIKSEMVGTYYTRPAPGKDEYVKVGSIVKPDTVVAVIVAMKVNNEIVAGCSGRVVEVCLKNEESVDYGTVLYRVDPS